MFSSDLNPSAQTQSQVNTNTRSSDIHDIQIEDDLISSQTSSQLKTEENKGLPPSTLVGITNYNNSMMAQGHNHNQNLPSMPPGSGYLDLNGKVVTGSNNNINNNVNKSINNVQNRMSFNNGNLSPNIGSPNDQVAFNNNNLQHTGYGTLVHGVQINGTDPQHQSHLHNNHQVNDIMQQSSSSENHLDYEKIKDEQKRLKRIDEQSRQAGYQYANSVVIILSTVVFTFYVLLCGHNSNFHSDAIHFRPFYASCDSYVNAYADNCEPKWLAKVGDLSGKSLNIKGQLPNHDMSIDGELYQYVGQPSETQINRMPPCTGLNGHCLPENCCLNDQEVDYYVKNQSNNNQGPGPFVTRKISKEMMETAKKYRINIQNTNTNIGTSTSTNSGTLSKTIPTTATTATGTNAVPDSANSNSNTIQGVTGPGSAATTVTGTLNQIQNQRPQQPVNAGSNR